MIGAGLDPPTRGRRRKVDEAAGAPTRARRVGVKVASTAVDLLAAAKFVKACKDELATLEAKHAKTEAMLREGLETLNTAIQQELEEVANR